MRKIYIGRVWIIIIAVFATLGCAKVQPTVDKVSNIAARYDLVKGDLVFNDGTGLGEMIAGTIIIEKLSSNQFGYYEMIKYKGLRPNAYWGGYIYEDGKFKNYPYNHLSKKFEASNGTELKINQKYLTIKSTFLNGNYTKVYKKVPFDTPLYISFKRASKRAKENYEQYYKKYVKRSSVN